MPLISTGVFNVPVETSTRAMIQGIRYWANVRSELHTPIQIIIMHSDEQVINTVLRVTAEELGNRYPGRIFLIKTQMDQ